MQDPAAMAQAMTALKQQAEGWMASYRASLEARGLGFSDDDLAAIEAAAVANPTPPPSSTPDIDVAELARQAQAAVYPADGFPPDDPRLAPIAGVALVEQAVAARAIGWSTDADLIALVLSGLGVDAAAWAQVSEQWQARVTGDMALGAFYGQLFIAADPLPRRPS
jgi:hypothetical protein